MDAFQGILISIGATLAVTAVWILTAGFLQMLKRIAIFLHIVRKPATERVEEVA